MARIDRCVICDYTESDGSGYAGVSPGRYGRVRRYGDEHLCDTCLDSVNQNVFDLSRKDKQEEEGEVPYELEADAPTVSLR